MAEEDSHEADKFRVLSSKLLQGWRHEAEESRSQWGNQRWVDTHFWKLEDTLTKTAKECLGSSRRWTRNRKTRSRGEADCAAR